MGALATNWLTKKNFSLSLLLVLFQMGKVEKGYLLFRRLKQYTLYMRYTLKLQTPLQNTNLEQNIVDKFTELN